MSTSQALKWKTSVQRRCFYRNLPTENYVFAVSLGYAMLDHKKKINKTILDAFSNKK